MSVDPADLLYPHLQSWPVPSRSGEIVLFRRDGEQVVFLNPEQVLGRDDQAIFPAAEADQLMAVGRQVVAENRTMTNEEVLTTTNGTSIFLTTKGPLHDAGGRVIGHFGISRDITARRAAENALRENEAFTRAVLDNLPVGIAVNSVDPAVSFACMNDNFPRFYRTTREKLAEPDAFWRSRCRSPAGGVKRRSTIPLRMRSKISEPATSTSSSWS